MTQAEVLAFQKKLLECVQVYAIQSADEGYVDAIYDNVESAQRHCKFLQRLHGKGTYRVVRHHLRTAELANMHFK